MSRVQKHSLPKHVFSLFTGSLYMCHISLGPIMSFKILETISTDRPLTCLTVLIFDLKKYHGGITRTNLCAHLHFLVCTDGRENSTYHHITKMSLLQLLDNTKDLRFTDGTYFCFAIILIAAIKTVCRVVNYLKHRNICMLYNIYCTLGIDNTNFKLTVQYPWYLDNYN